MTLVVIEALSSPLYFYINYLIVIEARVTSDVPLTLDDELLCSDYYNFYCSPRTPDLLILPFSTWLLRW